MTDTSNGSTNERGSSPSAGADEHLRRTSTGIIFGAAIVAAIVGVFGITNGTAGAIGVVALFISGLLTWFGFHRSRDRSVGGPASGRPGASVAVTEEDISKAQTLADTDLDLEDICRLTRGAYSWWTESEKTRFRDELSKHLER